MRWTVSWIMENICTYNICHFLFIKGKLCTSSDNQCTITVNQTLWPDHCIINSTDAKFSSQLKIEDEDIVVRKGYNCQVEHLHNHLILLL
jgi:hypothetical protein